MRRAPMHILIVDDNDDDRAEMRRLLLQGSDEHYAFTEAETGQAALATIAAGGRRMPGCILLDYYLPDMEAPEVLDALRGADNAALCPVVVLTAAAEYSFGPLLLRAGAQDYLSKEHMTSPALTRAIANAIERWKMGREIMDRERELRMIADNTPDILSRFDRAHRHVFVNAAAERSSGHPAAYLIGKTKGELGAPAHLCQLWETAMEAAFTSGQAQSIEFSSGIGPGRHHYAARLVPELGADGAVNHVLGVTHDITERRHAESLIKASAERLEMALSAARSGVWEWDIPADTINWSPESYVLYGRDPALGRPAYADWRTCLHPDDLARTEQQIHKALTGETPDFCHEFRICHPHRGIRWLSGLGKVEFDAAGKPLRMFGINLDVTERKQMEKALLEEDRRKDEFLATLAHELRNPLAAISAGLDLLGLIQDDAASAGRTRAMMQRQFSHMLRLVDDLLDVSRIGSGKIELQLAPVTVQSVVAHALESSEALIQQHGHQLEVRMPGEIIWVNGDLTRLAQVLANLLNNAAKYTPDGGSITLSVEAEGRQVAIRIADNGAGVPADMQERIFDLFTQVESTLDKARGGLGVGLSLVRRLVDMHGGAIGCESGGAGQGSTFTTRLDMAVAPPAGSASEVRDAPPIAAAAAERRVLIVDDNIDAADALALLLRISGYQTMTAHDGPEGLQASRTFKPHVVFLDIGLPGMNGYDVARRLRADQQTQAAYLVALTGWGSDEDRQRSSDAGFDLHLTKPVEMQTLANVLQQSVSSLHSSRSAATENRPG